MVAHKLRTWYKKRAVEGCRFTRMISSAFCGFQYYTHLATLQQIWDAKNRQRHKKRNEGKMLHQVLSFSFSIVVAGTADWPCKKENNVSGCILSKNSKKKVNIDWKLDSICLRFSHLPYQRASHPWAAEKSSWYNLVQDPPSLRMTDQSGYAPLLEQKWKTRYLRIRMYIMCIYIFNKKICFHRSIRDIIGRENQS